MTQLNVMPILVGMHDRASEKYKMVCKTGLCFHKNKGKKKLYQNLELWHSFFFKTFL